jgi:hypothetical protein
MNTGLSLELGCCIKPSPIGFSPLDISNLELWLDATDLSTISLRDSSYVTAWNDKSGQGNHFVQATEANQPVIGTNEVDFAGSFKNLIAGSNYIFSENDGMSILAVARAVSSGTDYYFVFDFGRFKVSGYGLHYSRAMYGCYAVNNQTTSVISEDTGFHRLAGIITFEDAIRIYLDNAIKNTLAIPGLTEINAANIAESPTPVQATSGPMTVGVASAYPVAATRDFTGAIKMLLVYTKKLSSSERSRLDSYFQTLP